MCSVAGTAEVTAFPRPPARPDTEAAPDSEPPEKPARALPLRRLLPRTWHSSRRQGKEAAAFPAARCRQRGLGPLARPLREAPRRCGCGAPVSSPAARAAPARAAANERLCFGVGAVKPGPGKGGGWREGVFRILFCLSVLS